MKASAQCAFAFWLFLSLLVSYGTATGSEQSTASSSDGATEFRIRSQNLHADYLENELDKLERELKDLSEPSAEDVARVKARIKRLEKTPCGENELLCGGLVHQCVNHLLVCDGVSDCHNGNDESQQICNSNLIKAGSTFTGISLAGEGMFLHDLHMTLIIQAVERSPIFPSHSIVRARYISGYGSELLTYPIDGRYIHASRRLQLGFADGRTDPFIVSCDFLPDNNRLYCKSYHEASNHKLTSYYFVRT